MQCQDVEAVEKGIKYKIEYHQSLITIFVRNLKTGKTKICEYNCSYDYWKGYSEDDIIEVYKIVEDFINELRRKAK